jgi:hypothetical protein
MRRGEEDVGVIGMRLTWCKRSAIGLNAECGMLNDQLSDERRMLNGELSEVQLSAFIAPHSSFIIHRFSLILLR